MFVWRLELGIEDAAPGFGADLSQPRVVSRLVADTLWRREGGRAGRVGEVRVGAVELVAHAQVGHLHQAGRGAQQVARLDITVNDLLVVNCQERERGKGRSAGRVSIGWEHSYHKNHTR